MARRYFAVDSRGDISETLNDQDDLVMAVEDAIDAAATANAVSGSNALITTELDAIQAAVTAQTANRPNGFIVASVNMSNVTSKTQLRKLLDAFYTHLANSTNFLT